MSEQELAEHESLYDFRWTRDEPQVLERRLPESSAAELETEMP
jgi:hypothetical protein